MNVAKIGKSYYSPQSAAISRVGAGSMGTMSNWSPRRLTWIEEGRQRERIVDRANDIAANNAHGASIIESITTNAVGSGIWPQARPHWKRLKITESQAQDIAEQMEYEFEQFALTADASAVDHSSATCNFYGIQYQNLFGLLVNGEFINLPLMLNDTNRRYSLALQALDPVRLRTPLSINGRADVRDGIRLGSMGQPTGYFIADPEDGRFSTSLDLRSFRELAPTSGHRPNILHRYIKKTPEQIRGVSVLAPAMKFFRDMADYMDFELVGSIVASSFPVWIEKNTPFDAFSTGTAGINGDPNYYRELSPGGVFYGNNGEKPHILGGTRPDNSFSVFIETILRAVGASCGMPYEIVSKDFSKTNYSSARAALEEAWRVFGMYQDWMVTHFCQVIYEMVFEEAFLKGYIKLPAGAPDFYTARSEWTAASWIVPERTQLDPVKEMSASIMGLNANITTAADICAKRGKDWEAQYAQRAREVKKARELDLPSNTDALKPQTDKKSPAESSPDDQQDNEQQDNEQQDDEQQDQDTQENLYAAC